ncbi:MAG: helix-turn-helix transcriptional regulator [Planctomycetes bacterium]|nr:helix-turn-helix transcriptional regulator [Planctomycetota bacterium]
MSGEKTSVVSISGIGPRLREVRAHRSQGAFAKTLGITQSTLSSIENEKSTPTLVFVLRAATQTGCNLTWLLTGEGGPYVGSLPQGTPTVAHIDIPKVVRRIVNLTWQEPAEVKENPQHYPDLIPFLGYFADTGIIEHPAREVEDDGLDLYASFGPMPKGSVSIQLLRPVGGYGTRAYLILGPQMKTPPKVGFGFLEVEGKPPLLLTAWERERKMYTLYSDVYTIKRVHAERVRSARLLVACV